MLFGKTTKYERNCGLIEVLAVGKADLKIPHHQGMQKISKNCTNTNTKFSIWMKRKE